MKSPSIKVGKVTAGGWKFHIPMKKKPSLLGVHTKIIKTFVMEICPTAGGELINVIWDR
jgi:hypothetical protein